MIYDEGSNSRERSKKNEDSNTVERMKKQAVTVVAKTGKILSGFQDSNGIPGLVLRLFDGSLHRGVPEDKGYEMIQFDGYDIFLGVEIGKIVGLDKARTSDIYTLFERMSEIRTLIKRSLQSGKQPNGSMLSDLRDHEIEFWHRFTLSSSCIIFAIMGVAFGVVRTRTVRSNSFIICLLILLVYYVFDGLGESWARSGKVPAGVGLWLSNFILFILSTISFRRVMH